MERESESEKERDYERERARCCCYTCVMVAPRVKIVASWSILAR